MTIIAIWTELKNELNKLNDPNYNKRPLIDKLSDLAQGHKIGDFVEKLYGGPPVNDEAPWTDHDRVVSLTPHLDQYVNMMELRAALRKIADDKSFKFSRFKNPEQCFSFAKNGPNCPTMDDMSEGQNNMAEMILSSYADSDEFKKREAS